MSDDVLRYDFTTAGILVELLELSGMNSEAARTALWRGLEQQRIDYDLKLRIVSKV